MSDSERTHEIKYTRPIVINGQVVDWESITENVVPITNLVLAELPFSRRNEMLKEQRLYYITPFVREFLGINDGMELSEQTVQLVSVVMDYRERELEVKRKSKSLQTASAEYEADKHTLKGKLLRKRMSKWGTEKPNSIREIESAELIRNDLIDGFILDFFPNIEGLKLAIEEIRDLAPSQIGKVDEFFVAVNSSLEGKVNVERVGRLHYLKDKNEIPSTKALSTLRQVVQEAGVTYQPYTTNFLISRVASDLIDLYAKNSELLFSRDRDIHLVRFAHDILFAACTTRDPNIVIEATKMLEQTVVRKEAYYKQQALLMARHLKDIEPWLVSGKKSNLVQLGRLLHRLDALGNKSHQSEMQEFLDKAEPTMNQILAESLIMMRSLCVDLGYSDSTLVRSSDVRSWEKQINRLGTEDLTKYYLSLLRDWLHEHDTLWTSASLFLSPSAYKPVFDLTREISTRTLNFTRKQRLDSGVVLSVGEILIHNFMRDENKNIHDVFKDNTKLDRQFGRIRDEYEYFVAPNGDRYVRLKDPGLDKWGIDSLTFYPVKGTRNVYKTVLRIGVPFDNGHYDLPLFIGQDGKIYNRDGVYPNIPVFVFNNICSLLYERLEYITSGAAFAGQEGELTRINTEPQTREVLARRAHWRTLNGNRYTLQSSVAQKHQEEVFEAYGINTWEEILSRRSRGTLGQNEVLTYVKAVLNEGAEPNLIVFDSEKLQRI